MALPDGAGQIFAVATRITQLDPFGFPAAGNNVYVTDKLIKATLTPTMETGDDIVTKNAAGNISFHYKHGDMPKYLAVNIDFAIPDPGLEVAICGGVNFTDSTVALTAPTGAAATPSITGGSLRAATYGYRLTSANQNGESLPSTEVTAAVASGVAGSVSLSWTAATGAVWTRIYGRTVGGEQLLAQVPAATLTFVDTGALAPSGHLPTVDTSAGPGIVGMQSPPLGIVGNPAGVSLEFWCYAIINGTLATNLPYFRWLVPYARNFHRDPQDFTNNALQSSYTGEAFENPNWGSGPFGDWNWDSSKVWQMARESAASLPTISNAAVAATL